MAEPSLGTARAASFRAVWRLHRLAGLCVAPVLLVLATTGGIYLFDREIDAWWNRALLAAEPGPALPLPVQEAAVAAAFPEAAISVLTLPRGPGEASRWHLTQPDGNGLEVFLDPVRGTITGTADPLANPTVVVRSLHGTLLAGEAGSYLVELTACWTLLMMLTGIWLWWPRHWRWRALLPRGSAAPARVRWRDWHAIPSLLNAALVVFLVLTGMPWSVFWGQQFAALGEWVPQVAPSPNFSARPLLPEAARPADDGTHAAHASEGKLPWPVRGLEAPAGSGGAARIAAVEPALATLPVERFGPGVRVFYPRGERGVFTVSYQPSKAEGQHTLYVDPADGAVLRDIGWADYSPAARVVEWGTMVHMGSQYGRANQFAGLAVCIVLVAATLAGLRLWFLRRPRGGGDPVAGRSMRLPRPIAVATVSLGILFPLLGASLLAAIAWGRVRGAMPG